MFKKVPSGVKLWAHQRKALNFLVEQLNSRADGACLVRMPTGTGKTGVIACLSMLCADSKCRTLVLTPWANLRKQMVQGLNAEFWNSIGYQRPNGKVVEMLPTTVSSILKARDNKVIICTFSTLTEIRRTSPELYKALSKFIHTVVVDECHYEPAVEWGKAVKGLKRQTALLTATPYRNDLKLFRIQDANASVFQFTHEQAEEQGIVRTLSVQAIPSSSNIKDFAVHFSMFWKSSKTNLIAKDAKAIICCSSHVDIERAVSQLVSQGINAIGIHEQFEGRRDAHLLKDVPSTEHEAEIWVHQNKLTEGLDDYRFCCLALFGQVQNDRKLIQQIGRVLRIHPSDRAKKTAILMAPVEYQVEGRWKAYREFEKHVELLSPEHYRQVVEGLLESQPKVEYFDGRFRRRFEADQLSADPQVSISPSVLVRAVNGEFKLSDYIEDCTDTLNLTDAIILGKPNSPCQKGKDYALWVYASISNSRLLESRSMYEVRLEAHCVVLSDGYLLISDTTGTYPEAYIESNTNGVGAAELAVLMSKEFRVTNVSVSSAVPFDTVLRASEHRGHDLSKIPASLTDRIQICRAARGASVNGRRYLGMQRGRVRQELAEAARRSHTFAHFKDWASAIAKSLKAASTNNPVLLRYMQTCKPPTKPIPVAISVDLHHPNIEISSASTQNLVIVASSVTVQPKAGMNAFAAVFEFKEKDKEADPILVEVMTEYQPGKGRFWFKTEGKQVVHIGEIGESKRRSLGDFLNQNQDLVLVALDGGDIVYQGRNFYAVDYSHAEKTLLEHIERPTLAPCMSEKGTKEELERAKDNQVTSFLSGSLFKLIAEGDLKLPFEPELVICDDLGSECADFILANFSERKLALVHAKAGHGALISASSFHDVVAQAMKNLVYLSRNAGAPAQVASWGPSIYWNNTRIPRLYRTPATGCPSGNDLWLKLRSDIIDTADAALYVILATTGCCDRTKLEEAIEDPAKRTPETAQLVHLLDGLNGYARQLGVRMRVYDVPYMATMTPPKTKPKKPTSAKTKHQKSVVTT